MNPLSWLNPGAVLVEITPRRLRVAHHDSVREWTLTRTGDGRLAEAETVRTELAAFLDRRPWQPHWDALCALPASGVTLRTVRIPRAGGVDLESVLRLQIESGWPLAPDDLAWGWRESRLRSNPPEVLLAAVRREIVAEYQSLLESVGLRPTFTLGAVARTLLAPEGESDGSHLHFGGEHTEWLQCDAHGPQRLRVLPWGEQSLLRDLVVQAELTPEAAAALVAAPGRRDAEGPMVSPSVQAVLEASAATLVRLLPRHGLGPRVYLSGPLGESPLFLSALARRLGAATECRRLESDAGSGRSTTFRGLRRLAGAGHADALLQLRHRPPEGATVLTRPAPRRWAVLAAVTLLAAFALPYAEALLLQPGLASRVAAIRKRKPDLDLIDRQSDFLRYLKQNQTPYLDVLLVLGKCTLPGLKVDGFNLNRKGELSLRVTLRQPQEAATFRTKLNDSGLFSSLVVEEQAPGPNRQGLILRLSGQVKPLPERAALKILAPDPVPGASTNNPGASTNKSAGTPPSPGAKSTNTPSLSGPTNPPAVPKSPPAPAPAPAPATATNPPGVTPPVPAVPVPAR